MKEVYMCELKGYHKWKKIFFMKMVLYMTIAHLEGAISLKKK